jgi:hypothetical protein
LDGQHIYMAGMGLWCRKWKFQKELNWEKNIICWYWSTESYTQTCRYEFISQILSDWWHIYMAGMGMWQQCWKCQKELDSDTLFFVFF